ncbi:hypothetical protein PENCOP_c007G03564 [Penicillium coprophilum]|nr:hypothetical protein PENCOP_c007G03564 [Penicillium coprophilum]
MGGGPSS